jgi:hypothetical protein
LFFILSLSLPLSLVGFYFHFECGVVAGAYTFFRFSHQLASWMLFWSEFGRVYTLKGKTAEEKFHFQTPTPAGESIARPTHGQIGDVFRLKLHVCEHSGEGVE